MRWSFAYKISHIDVHVEIYIRAVCTIQIEHIFRSMYCCVSFTKRRLLDWMEQSSLGLRLPCSTFLDSFSLFPQSQLYVWALCSGESLTALHVCVFVFTVQA